MRGGVQHAAAPRRRLRARHHLPRLRRSDDRRPPGQPARHRLRRGRDVLGSDALALAPFTDASPISRTATGPCLTPRRRRHPRPRRQCRSSGQSPARSPPRSWSTRATTATSWRRRSTSSRKWSAIRLRAYRRSRHRAASTLPDAAVRLRQAPTGSRISACGTAFYAGLVAKYWFERWARLPVDVDIASEFRYREARAGAGRRCRCSSRSRARPPTRWRRCATAARTASSVLSIVNVREVVDRARESDAVLPTLAGPEIGVASTKAFTCQLTVLACLAIAAGKRAGRYRREPRSRAGAGAGRSAASHGRRCCATRSPTRRSPIRCRKARDVLYLGRGTSYPIALEGALKLKEISYIHAEGYAAGELKHGPIALIDENDAGDRRRPARRSVREDRLEHAGGRGPRRPDRPRERRRC